MQFENNYEGLKFDKKLPALVAVWWELIVKSSYESYYMCTIKCFRKLFELETIGWHLSVETTVGSVGFMCTK